MTTTEKRKKNQKSKLDVSLASAIREIRKSKHLTQESFATVSSRTYLGVLERAEKQPAVDKIDSLARFMKVHPLTVLTLAYMKLENLSFEQLMGVIGEEISEWNNSDDFKEVP